MKRRERDLQKLLRPLGWIVSGQNGRSHYVLRGPTGQRTVAPASPGCRHADKNMMATLRRINAAAGKPDDSLRDNRRI